MHVAYGYGLFTGGLGAHYGAGEPTGEPEGVERSVGKMRRIVDERSR